MTDRRFVAYYRVSSEKQGRSGLGLEAQEMAVAAYVKDAALVEAFVEVETATRKGNRRPELARAIAACKVHKATLLIAKLDRLARNVHFVSGLMEAGVEFVCVDMPMANRLTIHILAAVAEHEAEMISKRTREALAAAKARGVKLGTPANLTRAAQRKGAQVARERAIEAYGPLGRRTTALAAEGASYRTIAATFNGEGLTTRRGQAFTAATVGRILARHQG